MAGLASSKKRGRFPGRPKLINDSHLREIEERKRKKGKGRKELSHHKIDEPSKFNFLLHFE